MFVGEAPGCGRGHRGTALRRPLRPVARPDAGGDRARPHEASTSPTSCRGGRPATARRRRRKPRSACRSSSGRSNWSIPTCWSASATRRRRRCSASRTASPRRAAAGIRFQHRRPRDPRDADLPSGLSAAQAVCRSASPGAISWRIKKALAGANVVNPRTRQCILHAPPDACAAERLAPAPHHPRGARHAQLRRTTDGRMPAGTPSRSAARPERRTMPSAELEHCEPPYFPSRAMRAAQKSRLSARFADFDGLLYERTVDEMSPIPCVIAKPRRMERRDEQVDRARACSTHAVDRPMHLPSGDGRRHDLSGRRIAAPATITIAPPDESARCRRTWPASDASAGALSGRPSADHRLHRRRRRGVTDLVRSGFCQSCRASAASQAHDHHRQVVRRHRSTLLVEMRCIARDRLSAAATRRSPRASALRP